MNFVDARRLTGPNVLAARPLVIVEVDFSAPETLEAVTAAYLHEVGRMRDALELPALGEVVIRAHQGGAAIGYDAPLDEMLVGAELSEWAGQSACLTLAGHAGLPLDPKRAELVRQLATERSPAMRALQAEAARRGLPFLWDDEELTLGLGAKSFSCPRHAPAQLNDVPWEMLGSIPVVMITGTNGKTTSSRLMARVASEAGHVVGLSSTGGVVIGGTTIEEGDWTGPAAARKVLRHRDVTFAVLETARGGILRRGLAVDSCDAALITNISDDHLGLYGIDDLWAMTQAKGLIAQAAKAVVLNASDPHLVRLSRQLTAPVSFFCDLDAKQGRDAGQAEALVVASHGAIVVRERGHELVLAQTADLPLSFKGAARYNVENILGVVALARAVGLPLAAIIEGISSFSALDNPGRGELVERQGIKVFLDFGHNPEAVRAVLQPIAELRTTGQLTVVTGCAGDRSNREIEDIARAIADAKPDRVLVRELPDYLRGRQPGEVPELFRSSLLRLGLPEANFRIVGSEVEALEDAFARGQPGDVVALLVHLDHPEVMAFLNDPTLVAEGQVAR